MRYLVRQSKRHRTYHYQRRWPADLTSTAKATIGSKFVIPTDCPVGASELEQAKAKALGDAEYERTVGLLEVVRQQATVGTQVGGISKNMLSRPKAQAVSKQTHDLFGLLELYHSVKPETGKAKLKREACWSAFCGHMVSNVAAVSTALEEIHAGLDRWQEDMEKRGLKGSSVQRQRNSVTGVLRWASMNYRLG